MTFQVAYTHAHVRRIVSVATTATVLEKYTTEEQRSLVRFLWAKGLNAKDIHKIWFLFTVGSVYHVKRFSLGGKRFADVE
jgi:hypothetical protein